MCALSASHAPNCPQIIEIHCQLKYAESYLFTCNDISLPLFVDSNENGRQQHHRKY